MHLSVVVPAHNEELLLPNTLAAIDVAAHQVDGDVEVIVADADGGGRPRTTDRRAGAD